MPVHRKTPKPSLYESPLDMAKAMLNDLIKKIDEDRTPPFKIGAKYLIRITDCCFVGKVKAIQGGFIVLAGSSCMVNEKEARNKLLGLKPSPCDVLINTFSVVDACEYKGKLP